MANPAERLELALQLFVSHRLGGGDWQALLTANPDLAELLEALRGDVAADGESGGAGADPGDDGEVMAGYRLGRVIGEGGIGVVHEARDRLLGRRVAIKLLRPEFATSPTALARFRREANSVARLDHPGLVRVLGAGESDGRHWIAMGFVDGDSLAAHLERLRAGGGHAGDSLRRLVQAIATVAEALHDAHEAGIVHRDVKPSNILLRRDGSPVLTDFGIARDRDDPTLTHAGALIGTPRYMAPEQVVHGGPACDPRSDVFSLGATLYECATLRPAFDGATNEAAMAAVVQRDPVDPRRVPGGVPSDLAAIVLRALEKDPARRYATARELAEDLRAFLDLREVAARSPSRLRRWGRRLRRQPAMAALLLLAVVAGALLLWIVVQWPRLTAAAAAARARAYDDAVVEGFLARGSTDEGRPAFERALAIDPARSEAPLGLVFATSRTRGPAAALAELEARAAGRADDNCVRCRAWLLDRLHRGAEADDLRRRLGPPRTAMGLWLDALTSLELRDDDGTALAHARESLSLAVRIAPQPNLLLYVQWASVVCNGGSVAARREAAEALLAIWPEHPLAVRLAGTAFLPVDAARAERLLRQALELGDRDPEVQVNLGLALLRLGERQPAVALLRQAFANPRAGDPLRVTAVRVVDQIDVAAADAMAANWLQAAADDPHALRFAGRAAFRRGDREVGIALLRRAVAALGDDADTRLDLAFALADGGAPDLAIGELRQVIAAQPGLERAHLQLLDALDARGDDSLAELQRWAELRPDDAVAWRELAEALAASPAAAAAERDLAAAERADLLAAGRDGRALELHALALERRGLREAAALLRARPQRTALR